MIPMAYQTITLKHRGPPTGKDGLGNNTYAPTESIIKGVNVQPMFSTETLGSMDRVITRWRMFLPPDTDISVVDTIEYNGEQFSIDGDPSSWPDWHGNPHHIECYLRKATG